MEVKEILAKVDHTQLKAFCTWEDIKTLCEEAIEFSTASVCIPPCYVKRVKETYGEKLTICTVIGFPLGYQLSEVKVLETKLAVEDGAKEIDMVINVTDVKNKDFSKILEEVKAVREACQDKILKVIIETCYLTEEEKIRLCSIVTEANADYIKTSTGFGTAGALKEDIQLFKKHIGEGVRIKAAGGVANLTDAQDFITLGCDRIGTSKAVGFVKNK